MWSLFCAHAAPDGAEPGAWAHKENFAHQRELRKQPVHPCMPSLLQVIAGQGGCGVL
jgi:hypothetical protein